jgi:hypothetical protein
VRRAIGGSVVHGDNVAHCQLDRGIANQDEPEERSPLSIKTAREGQKWWNCEGQEGERGNIARRPRSLARGA